MVEILVKLDLGMMFEVRTHLCPNRVEDIAPAFGNGKNVTALDIVTSMPVGTWFRYPQNGLFVRTEVID